MSNEFHRLYTYAGCAEDGQSCHSLSFHVQTFTYPEAAPENYIIYDSFSSVWFSNSTEPWEVYSPFMGGLPWGCSGGIRGVASRTVTTIDLTETLQGCENPVPDGWQPNGAPIRFFLLMNPQDVNYEQRYVNLVSTTPEPATVVLMASGLIGVFAARRRRQALA
jgi:hypothetical protein